jgi:hypothetical protein
MIEWGLTPEEFDNVDICLIQKIIEWRNARNKGEASKYKK